MQQKQITSISLVSHTGDDMVFCSAKCFLHKTKRSPCIMQGPSGAVGHHFLQSSKFSPAPPKIWSSRDNRLAEQSSSTGIVKLSLPIDTCSKEKSEIHLRESQSLVAAWDVIYLLLLHRQCHSPIFGTRTEPPAQERHSPTLVRLELHDDR